MQDYDGWRDNDPPQERSTSPESSAQERLGSRQISSGFNDFDGRFEGHFEGHHLRVRADGIRALRSLGRSREQKRPSVQIRKPRAKTCLDVPPVRAARVCILRGMKQGRSRKRQCVKKVQNCLRIQACWADLVTVFWLLSWLVHIAICTYLVVDSLNH